MLRITAVVLAALVGSATMAAAQDTSTPPPTTPPPPSTAPPPDPSEISRPLGAGWVELNVAPAGFTVFTQSATGIEPKFGNYTLAASATANLGHFIGIEGEVAWGMGRAQNFTFQGISLVNQNTPDILNYSASLVLSPLGVDHALVPYLDGGFGAMTAFGATDVTNIGVTTNQTFWLPSVGAGLKWWFSPHVGLRADYRFMHLLNDTTAPLFFGQESRNIHRLYLGIGFTY